MRVELPALVAALLVSTTLIATPVWAQHSAPVAAAQDDDRDPPPPVVSAARAATVPFELYRGNRVIVESKLNGHETRAILDTGASVSTVDLAYARSIGLPKGQKVEARGAGGVVEAELLANVTLEIGGTRFENATIAAMDLSSVAQQLGRPVTLVVGRELFNTTAIEFDWASRRLTMTPSAQFTPAAGSTVLPVERRGPFNFVKLSVAGLPPIDALLDLGNGNALKLPSDYWSKHPELANLRYATDLSGGVGGMHEVRYATVPTVDFAGRRFTAVPTMLGRDSQGNQPQYGANLGIGMLKQFDLTLDLGRNRVILKPLKDAPGFDRDRAGIRAVADASALRVAFVSPQGPAAQAGVEADDRIMAINGQPIGEDFFASSLGRWNYAPAGTRVTLALDSGKTVQFALADFY